jgi:hypothetical protein
VQVCERLVVSVKVRDSVGEEDSCEPFVDLPSELRAGGWGLGSIFLLEGRSGLLQRGRRAARQSFRTSCVCCTLAQAEASMDRTTFRLGRLAVGVRGEEQCCCGYGEERV